jgi:hypothetical protein
VSGFLDAFGDRIRKKDKDKLLNRVPKLFNIPSAEPTTPTQGVRRSGRFIVEEE